jgi:hypothetical protein
MQKGDFGFLRTLRVLIITFIHTPTVPVALRRITRHSWTNHLPALGQQRLDLRRTKKNYLGQTDNSSTLYSVHPTHYMDVQAEHAKCHHGTKQPAYN